MIDDTIVIKVPAGTKARWVRQAQREGRKLSDWIIQRMEQPVQPQTTTAAVVIPDPVYEGLQAEVLAEDAAGQHYSHAPGRA